MTITADAKSRYFIVLFSLGDKGWRQSRGKHQSNWDITLIRNDTTPALSPHPPNGGYVLGKDAESSRDIAERRSRSGSVASAAYLDGSIVFA